MEVKKIYEALDSLSPFATQESWDNCGLNVGSFNARVECIYLALECDMGVLDSMQENSLLITHHPLIFTPIKSFSPNIYPCNLITKLLAKNCALISMHTNFDKSHLNQYFANKILGFETQELGISQYANISPTPLKQLSESIKAKIGLEDIRIAQGSNMVEHLFIVCGAGFSALKDIATLNLPNSALISGDLKYHDATSAISMGINLIDVPHFHSEKYFPIVLNEILENRGYQAIICHSKNPITHQLM